MLRGLRSALVSGFLILLPFLLAYLLVGGFLDLLVLMTQPIADLLPQRGTLPAWARDLVQLATLVLVFVLVGAIRNTRPARAIGGWFENEVLLRFPPYRVVRSISRRLSGEAVPNMQAALVPVGPDQHTVGFIVEELPSRQLVSVYLPLTSTPTIGTLRIMPRSSVEPLETTFLDAAGWYFNWGAGTEALLRGHTPAGQWQTASRETGPERSSDGGSPAPDEGGRSR